MAAAAPDRIHDGARLDVFRAWMTTHHVWIDPRVAIVSGGADSGGGDKSDGRTETAADIGVIARETLHQGETLCRIPKAAVLSWRNSAAAAVIDEAGLRGAVATAVALTVERARGAASPWHGYLQLLPEREPLPLFWPAEDVGRLAGTQAAALLESDREQLRADYHRIVRPFYRRHGHALRLPPDATGYDAFAAAASLVASRAFNVDRHHGQAMVPLADMFNHRTAAETIHVVGSETACTCCPPEPDSDDDDDDDDSNDDDGGDDAGTDRTVLEMDLVADVPAKAEVWNTYGELGNAALLCKYGFAEDANPCDTVVLAADLVRASACEVVGEAQWKQRWRFWQRFADAEPEHTLGPSEAVPDGLLALLMTVTAPAAEFATWTDLAAVEAAPAEAILRDELVCAVLDLACSARWEAYTTAASVDEEVAALAGERSRPARYAALVRIGEKRVLEAVRGRVRAVQRKRRRRGGTRTL